MSGYDPDAKLTGEYIIPFLEAAGDVSPVFERKVKERLEDQMGEIKPDGRYRAEDVKIAYEDIVDEVGPKTMEEGAVATAGVLPFPEDSSIEEALDLLQQEHSGEGDTYIETDSDLPAGQYTHDIDGRTGHMGVTETFPYVEPFVKGVYRGIIKRFGPSDANPDFTETDPRPDERFAWKVEW